MCERKNTGIWLVVFASFALLVTGPVTAGKIIYVDHDASGANDGSSWQNAYTFLQDALADAEVAYKPVEIRVAQGIYTPDRNSVSPDGTGNRDDTFQLINGVTLKGGYVGFSETDPNARDIKAHQTILSGDLNGDDVEVADPCDLLAEPSRSDNSYHVVTGSGTDETAVLDGFTITAGNADRDEWQGNSSGGGICNHSGSPTVTSCTFSANSAVRDGGGLYNYLYSDAGVTKCTFSGNWASYGGGMSNAHSSPILDNCTFSANSADWTGGGMINSYNSPALTNCTFIANYACNGGGMANFVEGKPTLRACTFNENSAAEIGGGMYNDYYANATLDHCTFSENSADDNGGGLYNHENSDTTLTNCVFVQNLCGNGGGGMWNSMSNPTLFNCVFTGNRADFGGGLVSGFESNPVLTNCKFVGNSASEGGGVDNSFGGSPVLTNCVFSGNRGDWGTGGICSCFDSSPTLTNCTFVGNWGGDVGGVRMSWDGTSTLTNCILWGNSSPQLAGEGAVSYSDVQGGWEGDGNIDENPLFVDPGYWADANDASVIVEPNDPNAVWIDGDYHLKSQAGRWDANSQSWLQDDLTSPCIDAGDPNSPIGHEPFPNGGVINMGAYGGTAEASMSLSSAKCSIPWWAYDDWIEVGEPVCWCYPRQCHGDADCKCQGKQKYWVSTNDLDVLIAAWNKPFDEIEGKEVNGVPLICADFNLIPQGKERFRVSTLDLDILIANWNTANKPDPDCP